jgi:hypothetical protein
MNQIKRRATTFFETALEIVEIGIAVLLLVFIAVNLVSLFSHVRLDASLTDSFKTLQHYLELSLNLIICTEFIRMIYAHTMEAVLEALIFAIARGMIAGHMDGVQTLLYVAAIFVLMAVRKYLLTQKDDVQSFKSHLEAVCENIGIKIKDPDSK